ncbi:hypothetical protein GCM10010121_029770 [Streptomyces brasiliensis]|uniref:Uncharacterized protein n=1 Tax=Streptomyces brasiliensis TaxID=1954 RepID=A0A917KJL8_9ACTN|nr:hypothetical protein GCM10010121_029770 [Streptomyces brasiliensis]
MLAAADQDRFGPQHGAVAEVEAALLAQGEDGPDEVLSVAHASGHAVHGDTHRLACHIVPFVRQEPAAAAAAAVAASAVPPKPVRPACSKRFLHAEKLASHQWSLQDRDDVESFEGANNSGRWPYGLHDVT